MKCSEAGCSAPAEYRYVWRWGESGATCAEHQGHVRTIAQQLDCPISFVAVAVPKDELSQSLAIIRELATQLRGRIEEGLSSNPSTLRLAEDLARRMRNVPAPFGDALLAIREVGNAMLAESHDRAVQAIHRERQAGEQIKELERVVLQSEQSLANERGQFQKQVEALRTSLTQAHLQIGELETRLNDPDPAPPAPATERPGPDRPEPAIDLPDLFRGEESKLE